MSATPEGRLLTPQQRHAMCKSKKRFAEQNAAINFTIKCRQNGVFAGGRVYVCPVCAGWHVTSRGQVLDLQAPALAATG
jgi:hypothetical protein